MSLSDAVASFAANSSTSIPLDAPTGPDARIKIGIIGCGRIGQLHAANIVSKIPNATLVCVSDFFASAAEKLARRHNVPMACTDHKDMIENANVDAIIVCSPTDTHAGIIRDACAAGKHIFCEKPIDQSLAVIDELASLVQKSGVKFFVGFQRRFDKHFRSAKTAVEDGHIGTPVKLHLVSRDPAPPPIGYLKQSGGIFLDQTAHDFDMARFLVGSDIAEICATGVAVDKEIGQIGDWDHTVCQVKFKNGCVGIIDNSRSSPLGYDQRGEFFGTNGSIFIGNVKPSEATRCNKEGVREDNPMPFFMERYADAYVEEMKDFVHSIVENIPVSCGMSDGRKPVIYAAAAVKSAKEGKWVKIADIDV